MTRWFRHYVGMTNDPKLGGVARRCSNVAATGKCSRMDVFFVWNCILESAAEGNSAQYAWDADAIAELMGVETAFVQSIHDELERSGLLEKGRICKWDQRQFVSDSSTQRSRKHRATLQQQHATPPETDTETYTETEKKKEKEEAREKILATPEPEILPASKSRKPKSETNRGTSWPPDAVVPDDWLAEAEAVLELASKSRDVRVEALKFANYWAARAGEGGTKKDWKRTWLNWCLNDFGAMKNGKSNGQSRPTSLAGEVFGQLYADARSQREVAG